jgi:protein-disulfide isomerase
MNSLFRWWFRVSVWVFLHVNLVGAMNIVFMDVAYGERFTDSPTLGSKDASVVVVEFFSPSCVHCGNFHKHIFPTLKEKYINTGRVRWVLHEIYTNKYDLYAAQIMRCGGKDSYETLFNVLLENQEKWLKAREPLKSMERHVRIAGFPQKQLDSCLGDAKFSAELVSGFSERAKRYTVEATPTFYINGKKTEGSRSVQGMSLLIDEFLK